MALMTRHWVPSFLDGVLHGDAVDDGGEHAHVVRGDAVHVDGLRGDTAEEVAATDDDADLAAALSEFDDFTGDAGDEDGVDAEAAAGGKGLAGNFEQDAFVHSRISIAWWQRGQAVTSRTRRVGCVVKGWKKRQVLDGTSATVAGMPVDLQDLLSARALRTTARGVR